MKKLIGLSASALVVLGLSGCGYDRWNAWNHDCIAAEGVVTLVERGFWSDRFECSIDGEIVELPGWEHA